MLPVSRSSRSLVLDAEAALLRLGGLSARLRADPSREDGGRGRSAARDSEPDTDEAGDDGWAGDGSTGGGWPPAAGQAHDQVSGRGGGGRHGPPLRIDPGRPGAVVLCAVAIVSAGLAVALMWLSRPSPEPVALTPVVSSAFSAPPTAPTTSSATGAADVVVSVVGQVAAPGLVTLPAGSRVADAVAAAGGLLPDADVATVNLARVLVDGEQVAVGVPGAAVPSAAAGSGAGAGAGALVNLNTASEAQLEELPGVGPVLAGRIVEWRTANGGFQSVDQLQEVSGIGPAIFEQLRDQVSV